LRPELFSSVRLKDANEDESIAEGLTSNFLKKARRKVISCLSETMILIVWVRLVQLQYEVVAYA